VLIGDLVVHNAQAYGNRLGIVDETSWLTWKEVNGRANSLANALLALGFNKGDRIAIVSENCHQYAETFYATAKSGIVLVPPNYRLRGKQLVYIINDAEPYGLIVQDKFCQFVDPVLSELKSVKLLIGLGEGHNYPYDYETLVASYPSTEPEVEINENDTIILGYTSGTSGYSKGVPQTHKNRLSSSIPKCIHSCFTPDDSCLLSGPLFAVGAQLILFALTLSGCKIVTHHFTAKSFCELVERERVTWYSITPARYMLIKEYLKTAPRKYDLSSLNRMTMGGGQHCSGETLREIIDFFKVSCLGKEYAMTETGCGYTNLWEHDAAAALSPAATEREREKLESVGKPMIGLKRRVVNEKGKDVPVGEVGELLWKGDSVMSGYWKKPELNQQVLKDGWFHSGDLARLDEDGNMYFVGRKDMMIKSGGLLVGPSEVEEAILKHPSVAEVAVIGIPDVKWGEAVKAVVVPVKGQVVTEDEIRQHCRKYLAGFQVPKSVDFVEVLPKHPGTGKVIISELQQRYTKGGSQPHR